jgi:phenylacetate-CoA ligase
MTRPDGHFDALETRNAEARERALAEALARQVALAKSKTPYYAEALRAVEPAAVASRKALAALPITRKSSVPALQKKSMPFGGLVTLPPGEAGWIFQSPGPIYEPEARRPDYWRYARALHAAGARKGDIVHNTFAYHLTPAGRIVESAAHAIGCAVIPAGTGNTELQLKVIADLKPNFFGGTPSFLKILLERGRETGTDVSSLKNASVGGEALPPSLRKALNDLGVFVLQGYGTADLGLIAYESRAMEGLIVDEGVLVEIVHPGSGEPVAEGEVGEVVVTTFNPDYPLIRFATGDLSAVLPGASPCGRTNMRLKGWLGRADQTTKIKGMFVMPTQAQAAFARHKEILKGRVVVSSENNADVMTVLCEVAPGTAGIEAAIAQSIQDVCKLRATVKLVPAGSLANDGKIIEDARSYA